MKKILFPTDFSESANHAFVFALQVANHIGAKILTLHVYDLPDISAAHLPRTLEEVYESLELEEFENYRDRVPILHDIAAKAGFSNVTHSHIMEGGEIIPTILKVARRDAIDMIVMGTKGAGWLKGILLGTVAGEVLENASCPVIAVPLQAEFKGHLDRIAITTEFNEDEKKVLKRVIAFAHHFNAQIFCVNVDIAQTQDIAYRMDEFKQDFLGEENVSFVILEGSDLRKEITRFIEEQEIDVLAMLTHKRTFLEELFEYSLAKKMAYYAATPILSIQEHTLQSE